MKSVLFGWLLGIGLLLSHAGCCSVQLVGDGCGMGTCGGGCGVGGCVDGCDSCGVSAYGSIRSRIANRIRSTNCGSGCGEIYWDEHINEPPVCDPCGCNNEYECNSCRSCPSALARLRSLWGYRYVPASCEECSSCGTSEMHSGSGSCSTCASNTHSAPMMESHTTSNHVHTPASTRAPTPAARPTPVRENQVAPTPVPDSNASYEYEATPRERKSVGSGVASKGKTVVARPVSASSRQNTQGRPRLVTNPQ